ncbi:type II secretion system minor pseudopilin GspH [Aliivibrio kagoshimensis]|uniref:type II secretion system minor pseudopilin GspH n=1 Tax=Aliivibrio kagoshimensis TaxID=2910230 RepID=UPI003D109B42
MTASRGFTLIEIMLVLVLLSVSSLVVVMSLPENSNKQLEQQASRFYQLVQLLSEDALLNGTDFGVRVNESQAEYRFLTLGEQGWKEIEESRYFTHVKLEDDLQIAVELGGSAWLDKDRLFDTGSLFNDEMFDDLNEENRVKPPQIVVLSSGEITPFTVTFSTKTEGTSSAREWQVNTDQAGLVTLLRPGEDDDER